MDANLAIRETTLSTLPRVSTEDIEQALTIGDLAKMPPEVRIRYYCATCASAGLNPMTQPFTPMKNQAGQVVLYANKEAAEQLRKRDRISIRILSREKDDGLYIVTVAASTPDGRCEESQGIIEITNLKGTALANAMMKCETKAKRRVTMALCGLGFPMDDEYGGRPVAFDLRTGEIPLDDVEDNPPSLEQAKSLQDHISDLYGDRPQADPRQTILGQAITQRLSDAGLSPDQQEAAWSAWRQKYPDLTPGVLSMLHDKIEAKYQASRAPQTPQDDEPQEPTLWEQESPDKEQDMPF